MDPETCLIFLAITIPEFDLESVEDISQPGALSLSPCCSSKDARMPPA